MVRHDLRLSNPPIIRAIPCGKRTTLDALCNAAGIKNNVTPSNPPDIRLQMSGQDILAAPGPGVRVYCVDVIGMPEDTKRRAADVLGKLAYGFLLWEAREIVRRQRHVERETRNKSVPANVLRRALSPFSIAVAESIKDYGPVSVQDLANHLGAQQSNVSRTLRILERVGAVRIEKAGRSRRPVFLRYPDDCV